MTDFASESRIKPARALISVSDKTGIVDFAKALHDAGVEILSTGGTARKRVSRSPRFRPTLVFLK